MDATKPYEFIGFGAMAWLILSMAYKMCRAGLVGMGGTRPKIDDFGVADVTALKRGRQQGNTVELSTPGTG